MAKKLKNLEVTKVDFVDEGANQGANIKLFKRKDQNDNPVVAVPVQDPMKEQKSLFKRLMHSIGKSLGFNDEEIDSFSEPSADGNVQKGNSQTFGDKMTEVKRQKVADEIWSICYGLHVPRDSHGDLVVADVVHHVFRGVALLSGIGHLIGQLLVPVL